MKSAYIVTQLLERELIQTQLDPATVLEMEAIPADKVLVLNVDPPTVTTKVLGALPKLIALHDQFIIHTPTFDIKVLSRVPNYALALQLSHLNYLRTTVCPADLKALREEAIETCEILRKDITAAARHALVDPTPIPDFDGRKRKNDDLATELGLMLRLCRDNWTLLCGQSALTLAQLDRAEQITSALLRCVARRNQAVSEVTKGRRYAPPRLHPPGSRLRPGAPGL